MMEALYIFLVLKGGRADWSFDEMEILFVKYENGSLTEMLICL